ncbi:putative proline-rich receptor-like protein kinase PERK8 [Iris pallida]|uniref:Proline-rich receptor-like protein kinase PERK8 n=1 Tax=Iris pallida TaxID=29817 RepID=A0AAX6EDE9_IRIPA|nr:putative proline-rich receptor-like protein kinase PERK8 [Iris pallida]
MMMMMVDGVRGGGTRWGGAAGMGRSGQGCGSTGQHRRHKRAWGRWLAGTRVTRWLLAAVGQGRAGDGRPFRVRF